MLIIGTAGHIDHGKTSLIKALNGFEGDTLKEEQERQITLSLSFSSLEKEGKKLSFIDTPGHKDLLKTMISGAFAFNVCLFVVDINEGLKAQSLEHLSVLELLGVKDLILVLNKCDLCEDIDAKTKEIAAQLSLKPLKIFHTSVRSNLGIESLKNYLFSLQEKESEEAIFHFYIDRVFSLKGVGTIVTGSLNEGEIALKEKIICLDTQQELIIKNIQNHDSNLDQIKAPARVALSLNCDYKNLQKGFLLSKKGFFKPFLQIEAYVKAPNLANQNYVFCVGTKQLEAKIHTLKELKVGEYYAEIRFKKPMYLCFDERFILLENARVKGGGVVLNPVSEPLNKELKLRLLDLLLNKNFLSAFDLLKNAHKKGFGLLSSYQRFKLSRTQALNVANNLQNAFIDEKNYNIYDTSSINLLQNSIHKILAKNPYAMLSAHSLALRNAWASEGICAFALENMSILEFKNGIFFKKGVEFEKLQEKNSNALYEKIKAQALQVEAPYNLYESLELDRKSGDLMLKKLTKEGLVVRLAHNLFVDKATLLNFKEELLNLLKNTSLDVQTMKTRFHFSRKYAIAYLEYLDLDERIIKKDEKRFLKSNI
ncbi:selenocysteine-specific translation elongation factor [Campylobacter upsaliensis]|uniref:selenocysteine-specific translation elongation factor n=1 Tax=Campylobacter upsaliensis TaxID=28080 RepID=UPI00126B5E5B|nr:selenocysteine-specific translation elongation factor [Campylobacter upsaliensis]EAH5217703.1 selenocysteine-specific translation elongation factor [Campylobacter upsaliensis]EAH5879994.1 selenocysteine-specific translation elongation factor [Campylobacter upsaliensis]EAH5977812.1 selenocysteine-specific translation elongation factor [Campylobacter upsaliensis]EAI7245251.1 selenocysteine-specific translation elongation factor [Campylobacter upsaliensis]EAJ0467794.1 selenocysteine-specific t